MPSTSTWFVVLSSSLALSLSACGGGPRAVRGDDVAGLDNQAMSTGLDRRDLQKMGNELLQMMQTAPVIQRWQGENRPAIAVLPIRNETSEHIDSGLSALISDIETSLINSGVVRVISHENQAALMEEIRQQSTDAFNPQQIAQWGQQVGARYFVTGKVFTTDERMSSERRVQYYLFLQVLDVQTGEILWQNKTAVTKAIVN
jgi:uncharacterized protein (TIGR02722 family)